MKRNGKMANANPNVLVIILNINGLNTQEARTTMKI